VFVASVAGGIVALEVRADPPVVGNPGGAVSVVAGSSVSCAVLATSAGPGAAECWGANSSGQLGRDNKVTRGDGTHPMETLGAVALAFDPGDGVAEVALGGGHTCARSAGGEVICWGRNAEGQLGIGSTATRGDGANEMAALTPLAIGAGRIAAQVTAGDDHTCILASSADVVCWGYNAEGQLGLGDGDSRGDEPGEMADLDHVALGGPVSQVSSGANHVCALMQSDSVVCWGDNSHGQLGRGDTANRGDDPGEVGPSGAVPLPLAPDETVAQVSAGGAHTCAMTDAGRVWCWGRNNRGQLGLGDTASRGDAAGEIAAMAAVPLPVSASAISAGFEHSCAVLADDTVRCWGNNSNGRLGYGNESDLGDETGEIDALGAVPMAGSRHGVAVSAGRFHTCILRDNGTVVCWGDNAEGQLGRDDTATRGDNPGEVASMPPVVLTPPAVGLDAVATTSTTATAIFDLAADEPLECATLSDSVGTDLTATSASGLTVVQHAPDTCRITVTSTVAEGETGTVTVALAESFAVADATGQVTTTAVLGDLTVSVDRAVPVTVPTTVPVTVPTTVPTTVPDARPPLTVRIGRSMRLTRVLNRAAVSAPSLSRVWVSVRRRSATVCSLRSGRVVGRRAGGCRLVITVVGRGGSTVRHRAVLRVVRR
jgi:alpha-tubulin suppressor-like RCC1 family protein